MVGPLALVNAPLSPALSPFVPHGARETERYSSRRFRRELSQRLIPNGFQNRLTSYLTHLPPLTMKTHSGASPTQFRDRLLLGLLFVAIPLLQTYPVWSQGAGGPFILPPDPTAAATAPTCAAPPTIEYEGKQITRAKLGFQEFTPGHNLNVSGVPGPQFANSVPPKYFLDLAETRALTYRVEENYREADWSEGPWHPGWGWVVGTNATTNLSSYSFQET